MSYLILVPATPLQVTQLPLQTRRFLPLFHLVPSPYRRRLACLVLRFSAPWRRQGRQGRRDACGTGKVDAASLPRCSPCAQGEAGKEAGSLFYFVCAPRRTQSKRSPLHGNSSYSQRTGTYPMMCPSVRMMLGHKLCSKEHGPPHIGAARNAVSVSGKSFWRNHNIWLQI